MQITTIGAPIWPADPATFEYEGEKYDVYLVPIPTARPRSSRWSTRDGRRAGSSIPADPDAGVITWQGSWRALEQPWEFAPQWGNFVEVWTHHRTSRG